MKKTSIVFILIIIMIVGSIIRLYRLTDVPAGLLQDEAAAGYDAYSLIKTGKDHHGALLPVTFQTFNDWTGHSFNYQLIPAVFFFGLNTFSIRFTVAFLSIVTIVLVYLLGKELTGNDIVSILMSFLFSLSQFSVTTSRWAVQPNTVVFFVTLSLYLFNRGLNKENRLLWWVVSFVFFGLSLYTYPSVEGFVPLFLLGVLFIIFFCRRKKEMKKVSRDSIFCGVVFLLIALPLITDHIKRPETISTKLRMVSVATIGGNPVVNYLKNYISYFLPTPLFLPGEVNPTRALPGFGYENTLLGVFYYFGIILLVFFQRNIIRRYTLLTREKIRFLYLYLILFPVVPSLTVPWGDFQRAIFILPVLIFLASLSIHYCFDVIKKIKLASFIQYRAYFWAVAILIYIYLQYNAFSYYFGPKYKAFAQWYFQYGLEEVVKFTGSNENKYRNIIIDSTINQPYIYILFYKKVDPGTLTAENYKDFSEIDPKTNWLSVKKYRQYRFKKVGEEDVAGGKLIKTVKNSPVSDYALYEKDGDLVVRFETKRLEAPKRDET